MGSGSARLTFPSLVMDSPFRGSEVLLRTIMFNSGENQFSEMVTIGRSFPTDPVGQVVVLLLPSAITPSIIWVPIDSCVVCGRGLWFCEAVGGGTGETGTTRPAGLPGVNKIPFAAPCRPAAVGIWNRRAIFVRVSKVYRTPTRGSLMSIIVGPGVP